MKKVWLLLALVTVALSGAGGLRAYAAQSDSTTVTMNALNGSGEDGTATITKVSDSSVKVVIDLKNPPADAQPAHIHKGGCANLDPSPTFPLTNVAAGKSETTINVSLSELQSGNYAINVHKSATEITTYVSCGDIQAMSAGSGTSSQGGGTMPTTGSGDQAVMILGFGLVALLLVAAGVRLARSKA